MFIANSYTPTRVIFGAGCLNQLDQIQFPGKKALVCMTDGQRLKNTGIPQKVFSSLEKNGIEMEIFQKITANPTKKSVEEAGRLAIESGCDFVIGLGGGSSIDAAKGAALLMANGGDLWDYAYTGSGKRKAIVKAAPVVAISTTSGTGTETDPYCVITKTQTGEKLDFSSDALFPKISIIDPEVMLSLPKDLTIYQGFDALFHAAECYISNQHENRLVDLFAEESVRTVNEWLPIVVEDGGNLEARTHMAYAANICSGYTQAMVGTTSHHIIAQTMGGLFPNLAHGASLIMIAQAYYRRVSSYFPEIFDQLGVWMGQTKNEQQPGSAFEKALETLMKKTGVFNLSMKETGIVSSDLKTIADFAVNRTGIADVDRYPEALSVRDVEKILEHSYR